MFLHQFAVLELPPSIKLNVKHIDYTSQTVQLYDPHGCLSLHLPSLTLPPPSPFQLQASLFLDDDDDDDFTVFNCSQPKSSEDVKLISTCQRRSTYHVYAISSSAYIRQFQLLSCTKVFNISSVPGKIFRDDYSLHLKWSNPRCKHCESSGRRCRFKNSSISNETACFEIGMIWSTFSTNPNVRPYHGFIHIIVASNRYTNSHEHGKH
ncbi:RING-H2 finger protein ATL22-like [Neltuma alba]|uniref:RING-H2 finger protein ATL22-like n=1 Tax=Neltuma alba TaxID=207710 RepID=UPI0010A422A5|nr:RING-H2 finger protein ATL22-like [Prosopis alba]